MRTVENKGTAFLFNELNSEAQERAINSHRYVNLYDRWEQDKLFPMFRRWCSNSGVELYDMVTTSQQIITFESALALIRPFLRAAGCPQQYRDTLVDLFDDYDLSAGTDGLSYQEAEIDLLVGTSSEDRKEAVRWMEAAWKRWALKMSEAMTREWRVELAYRQSDAAVRETLVLDYYEFYENGEPF